MKLPGLGSRGIFVATLLLLSAPVWAQTRPVVIQGGTLIDGTGRAPLENAVIVIEGDRIKAVGKQGEIAIPKDSRVVSMKGKFQGVMSAATPIGRRWW